MSQPNTVLPSVDEEEEMNSSSNENQTSATAQSECGKTAKVAEAELIERLIQRHPHVGRTEGILGGKLIVGGIRIAVTNILAYLYNGNSIEHISKTYGLTPEQVKCAIAFAQDFIEESDDRGRASETVKTANVAEAGEWRSDLASLASLPEGYYWMRIDTGDHSPVIVRWEGLELNEVGVQGDIRAVVDVTEFEFLGPLPMPAPPFASVQDTESRALAGQHSDDAPEGVLQHDHRSEFANCPACQQLGRIEEDTSIVPPSAVEGVSDVEAALAELRELFPSPEELIRISQTRWTTGTGGTVEIERIMCDMNEETVGKGATLVEAMAAVRERKGKQQ